MKIKKLDVQDIAKLLIHDEIQLENHFPGERGEIVQWLIQNIDNPGLFIWGSLDDSGEITGVLIALNSVALPISNHISIIYCHTSHDLEMNKQVKEELDKWGREMGAVAVNFICENIRVFEKYGGTEQAIAGGWAL